MRTGIHISEQQRIVSFMHGVLRTQFWSMIVVGISSILIFSGFLFAPRESAPTPAVAWIQTNDSPGGAGFLVAPNLILTTARIAGHQSSVNVSFAQQSAIAGKVIFTDESNDIALIEVNDSSVSVSPFPLGDSDAASSRESVLILGFPDGSLSSTKTDLISQSTKELKTTSPAHPGNSGGPLIRSIDQSVIGVVASTRELGSDKNELQHWAIPINIVKTICRERGKPIG